jgi:hypothetical protein
MSSRDTRFILAMSLGALLIAAAHDARASEVAADTLRPQSGATPAAATPPPTFGDRGEVVIGSDAFAGGFSQFYQGNQNDAVEIEPSIDYFVTRHLSLGGALTFAYSSFSGAGSSAHLFTYGLAPRIGYDIALSNYFSLWPKASIFLTEQNDTSQNYGAAATTTRQSDVAVELFVPVLFHPAPHVFFGFGPYAELGSPSGAIFGGKLTLGGWFGG